MKIRRRRCAALAAGASLLLCSAASSTAGTVANSADSARSTAPLSSTVELSDKSAAPALSPRPRVRVENAIAPLDQPTEAAAPEINSVRWIDAQRMPLTDVASHDARLNRIIADPGSAMRAVNGASDFSPMPIGGELSSGDRYTFDERRGDFQIYDPRDPRRGDAVEVHSIPFQTATQLFPAGAAAAAFALFRMRSRR